jgi:hypothetical protein
MGYDMSYVRDFQYLWGRLNDDFCYHWGLEQLLDCTLLTFHYKHTGVPTQRNGWIVDCMLPIIMDFVLESRHLYQK